MKQVVKTKINTLSRWNFNERKRKTIFVLIYTLVLVIMLIGAIRYNQSKINEVEETLVNKILKLEGEIKKLQSKDLFLEETILEKGLKIEGLTGELEKVKIESKEQLNVLEDKLSKLKAENKDFSEVIDNVLPAIVSIHTNVGSGSGFLVAGDGYIVTNNHVIEKATAATITTFDGQNHGVRIVGLSKTADIAVLQILGNNFDFLTFGNSENVNIGQRVIALGNPGGLDFTVTEGIISAIDRRDALGNEFIQIDVAINPGNSGGPLVDSNEKVIGINTKKILGFEGIGFSLGSNQVKEIVDEIILNDAEGES